MTISAPGTPLTSTTVDLSERYKSTLVGSPGRIDRRLAIDKLPCSGKAFPAGNLGTAKVAGASRSTDWPRRHRLMFK
jgi:hypothetical protein